MNEHFIHGFVDEMEKLASQPLPPRPPKWVPRTPDQPQPKPRQTLGGPKTGLGKLLEKIKAKMPRS